MNNYHCLLLIGFLLAACGGGDDRIRELEEQVAQLEDENARLRTQVVPADPAVGTPSTTPTTSPVTRDDNWQEAQSAEPEGVVEEPPSAELLSAVDGSASSQATAAAAATASGSPTLTIYRAVLAKDVQNRAPVGEADSFSASVGKVYCYTEVGPTGGATELVHRWSHEGRAEGTTRLKVKGDHWRTFSNRTVTDKPGAWRVELVDAGGLVLQTLEFTVR